MSVGPQICKSNLRLCQLHSYQEHLQEDMQFRYNEFRLILILKQFNLLLRILFCHFYLVKTSMEVFLEFLQQKGPHRLLQHLRGPYRSHQKSFVCFLVLISQFLACFVLIMILYKVHQLLLLLLQIYLHQIHQPKIQRHHTLQNTFAIFFLKIFVLQHPRRGIPRMIY